MNIKEAKIEISNTLKVYHEKDENGDYCYPLVNQRPILLMGPPGIGKTAIMEQIARENGVGLVAYTITHHTRQSAVGLPRIKEKSYDGEQRTVTEYTMSEIIDSVYNCMERTGKKEGILFVDEINCASETLAPTMLQFLQNKTFGSHKVPEGWMIVAAGNPPEYNKSVREFDIVTLDRVRRIDVEVDQAVWMDYAIGRNLHGAILSYLTLKKENFYCVENKADGKFFVTARGWEDLSHLLGSYERMGIPVSEKQILQFLQKEEIAVDFADYYQLYVKHGQDYSIAEILEGKLQEKERLGKIELAKKGGFEERFIVTELVLSYLKSSFDAWEENEEHLDMLHEQLMRYKKEMGDISFTEYIQELAQRFLVKKNSDLLSAREIRQEKRVIRSLQQMDLDVKQNHIPDVKEGFDNLRKLFLTEAEHFKKEEKTRKGILDRAFALINDSFGDGQEMILFVTRLAAGETVMRFVSEHGCDAFFTYSEHLLYRNKRDELQKACLNEKG